MSVPIFFILSCPGFFVFLFLGWPFSGYGFLFFYPVEGERGIYKFIPYGEILFIIYYYSLLTARLLKTGAGVFSSKLALELDRAKRGGHLPLKSAVKGARLPT